MRILLSSYSFGANRGSEAGVGWNVAKGLAQRGHEITVLTTTEFHAVNEPAVRESGLPVRLVEWDAGLSAAEFPLAFSYRRWQQAAGARLRQLCAETSFDIVHHVTFNQYRGVKDVFASGLPYVVGPVGGAETVPRCLLGDLPLGRRIKEMVRRLPWDALPLGRRVRSAAAPGMILASTPGTQRRLQRTAGIAGVRLMPVIAIAGEEIAVEPPTSSADPFFVFYGGGARAEKGTLLLLRCMARLWKQGVHVPVRLVAVQESLRPGLQRYAASQGLPPGAVEFPPFMPRSELLALMRRSAAFVALNFRDDGCMALLEAVAQGVPSVCLDIPSQFWLPQEFALKVPVRAGEVEASLAHALDKALHSPPADAAWHRRRVSFLREKMLWPVRIGQLEQCYNELLTHF